MMQLDLAGLTALVYNRVKVDAQGAAVRALLGASAASIIHALAIGTKPPRPFLALRRGATSQRDTINHTVPYLWWLYDDPQQGYYRLNQLAPLLALAYSTPRLYLPGAAITAVEVDDVGQETEDQALGLLTIPMRLYIYAA